MKRSLDTTTLVEIPVGATSVDQIISLPSGTLLGIAVYDDQQNTPKHTRVELEQNGNPIVEARHISAFRRESNDGKPRQVMVECDGVYKIRVNHFGPAQVASHIIEVEFIISPEKMLQHFQSN